MVLQRNVSGVAAPVSGKLETVRTSPSATVPIQVVPSLLFPFLCVKFIADFGHRILQFPYQELKRQLSGMASFRAFLNSPVGPKTTHFWGPIANWGFVAAGLADMKKPPEMISGNMTAGSKLLVPRNYLLLVCHASNETVQLYQLSRWAKGQGYLSEKKEEAASE
ncbi:hypothetical protein L484_000871 [Morus notabilis]|uniref:Mitochondrial pyruvate carrier n=1 Tax=Morus notabilis TaxID=981085 RepID=W9T2L8_9ROSA|nr:hypothetical protein L484_000871 [Morus notabilis]